MTTIADQATCMCGSVRSIPAVPYPARLLRCTDCGLVFTAGMAAPTSAYDEDYFSDGGYHSYFSRVRQWRYEARRRVRWLLGVARPRTLVEIGSAGGYFVHAVRRAGIDARGIEASEPAARYAQRTLGIPVVTARFEDADLDGPFDAVCAFHVLEHVDDPRGFLAKVRGLIGAAGCLALEVPNIESAAATADGIEWPGLQPAYHRWHFAPKTLVRLVQEARFRVIDCDTVFARFYTRPTRRLSRGFVDELRSVARTGSVQAVDPRLGDHIRLVARPLS